MLLVLLVLLVLLLMLLLVVRPFGGRLNLGVELLQQLTRTGHSAVRISLISLLLLVLLVLVLLILLRRLVLI